ncbi:hypothetical protein [Bifidobacterium platyrrhinorum]|uniref:hypothetical protein n=1 Tax=Bifidobacterium platyrrhinorum TaxID=2661628 RepID=UPI0013D87C7D|nr:hypothetical protein [Bifidobacterium platyrrhinorum]
MIVDTPFEFDGYQQNFTWATNSRPNTILTDGDSLRLTGTGGISDWPVGTYIYLQSTWIVKDK